LAIPFFRANLGLSDDRVGPKNMSSHVATEQYRKNFATREADALSVYVPGIDSVADRSEIDRLARKLKNIPGVTRVDALTGEYLVTNPKSVAAPPIPGLADRFAAPKGQKGTYLSVIPAVDPLSSQGEQLVKDIRATPSPFPLTVAG